MTTESRGQGTTTIAGDPWGTQSIRCEGCGHTLASHDPKCGAVDAAGDTCDCDRFRSY